MKTYMPIVEYIAKNARNKDHAIIGRDVGKVFGITNVEVRKHINEARRHNVPICSCTSGYYYSNNADDIEKTIKHLRGRISKVECAIAGLSGAMNDIF